MEIICIGLAVYDILARPYSKEDFDVDSVRLDNLAFCPGGDALNAALNLAALGAKTSLICRVGDDPFGRELQSTVRDSGIDASGMVVDPHNATSTSIVLIDRAGNRRFAYYGKSNERLSLSDIDFARFRPGSIVHVGSALALGTLDGQLAELFREAKARGCRTSMDVTWDSEGLWFKKIEPALGYLDDFMPSLDEARRISGERTPQDIARFFSRYPIKRLVIKLGEQGCYVTDFNESHALPAMQGGGVVDTTGAGDAFVAGFLYGTLSGHSIVQSARLGSLVAADAIMDYGATSRVRALYHGNPGAIDALLRKARAE